MKYMKWYRRWAFVLAAVFFCLRTTFLIIDRQSSGDVFIWIIFGFWFLWFIWTYFHDMDLPIMGPLGKFRENKKNIGRIIQLWFWTAVFVLLLLGGV